MTQAARLRGYLLATGLAMSCLASSGAAAAPSQTWERHNTAGLAALEARDPAEARRILEQMLGYSEEAILAEATRLEAEGLIGPAARRDPS